MGKGHKPCARKSGVVIRRFGDESIVYDVERHRAHYLDATATRVFRACDGERSERDLAAHLARHTPKAETKLRPADARAVVQWTLRRLARAQLLEPDRGEIDPSDAPRWSRRALLKRLSTAAALPVIVSMVSPTPADAASCNPVGTSCTHSSQCCPNNINLRCCRAGTCANGAGACI